MRAPIQTELLEAAPLAASARQEKNGMHEILGAAAYIVGEFTE